MCYHPYRLLLLIFFSGADLTHQNSNPSPAFSNMGYFDDHFEEIVMEMYEADLAAEAAEAAEAEAQERADAAADAEAAGKS